ncbi:hypothetical protein, partial [Methylobacterium sp.]|uniref:hypothetical protein n=1 Tax=Methylobacterium sp. TaxID=409 RepID=UPI0025CF0394
MTPRCKISNRPDFAPDRRHAAMVSAVHERRSAGNDPETVDPAGSPARRGRDLAQALPGAEITRDGAYLASSLLG